MSAVRKTVYELSTSITFPRSPIIEPPIDVAFTIPSYVLPYIMSSVQFHGWPDENPYTHLNRFRRICSTFKLSRVSDDAIYLRLFPLSLCDKALIWLDCMPMGSITTWDDLVDKFLTRYFPRSKIGILRKEIYSFYQEDGEAFHETWERFNDLLAGCPPHGFEPRTQVVIFYEGLTVETREWVDLTVGVRCCLFFLQENLFCCRPHLQTSAGEEVDQSPEVCRKKTVCFLTSADC